MSTFQCTKNAPKHSVDYDWQRRMVEDIVNFERRSISPPTNRLKPSTDMYRNRFKPVPNYEHFWPGTRATQLIYSTWCVRFSQQLHYINYQHCLPGLQHQLNYNIRMDREHIQYGQKRRSPKSTTSSTTSRRRSGNSCVINK